MVALRYGNKTASKQKRIAAELIDLVAYLESHITIDDLLAGSDLVASVDSKHELGNLIIVLLKVEELGRKISLQWEFDYETRELSAKQAFASIIHASVVHKVPLATRISLQNIRYITEKLGDPVFPTEAYAEACMQVILSGPAAWGFDAECTEADILSKMRFVTPPKTLVAQLLNQLLP